jgi:uncharacterized protein (DUF58 family)
MGFAYPLFFAIGKVMLIALLALVLLDLMLLFRLQKGISADRFAPDKLSNGDENDIVLKLQNHYTFPVKLEIIDEIPHQFQVRDFKIDAQLKSGKSQSIGYKLRPTKRGEYHFGILNVFTTSPIALFSRRFKFAEDAKVPVYPSYLQMRKYELMAISNRLTEVGIKKIRKIGQNMEFDQIRDYVQGDDFRSVNWKATARRNQLMVNQYQDEKSQQVYCLIDKGRSMQMPFEGMTLLDYAINASLVLSNIAIRKQDKAGLITFNNGTKTILKATDRNSQMYSIMETLYREKTAFLESDFENLYVNVRRSLSQRSLLVLFTNFEAMSSMERQLKYLRALAKNHLLIVVFFENTETQGLIESEASSTEEIYIQTIAEKFAFEKRQIVRELQKYGIFSILTSPQDLTVNTINKYLELKARGLL